jgi:hypothetical protein
MPATFFHDLQNLNFSGSKKYNFLAEQEFSRERGSLRKQGYVEVT